MKAIRTVLLLGSGALKIGEAGEFDYSGTQAIKALKEEGKKVVLVNPNIATIQTSAGLADEIYFLPVNADFVTKVIEKEKPDGIMVSFGGQTALNCGMELYKRNVLQKYNVSILGTPISAIVATEDRQLFAEKLASLHIKTAVGQTVSTLSQARAFAQKNGYPVMLRTGYALGGTGSGILRNEKQLIERVTRALTVFPQIVLEECLYGWKELEYEVVRDRDDNCVTVCNMENFDPTGIHTGESIVVAPSQTLNNQEYFMLRDMAIAVIRGFGIVGECNIQYALHPRTGDYRVIEVNARLSRSSALASKATGYPLAYVATKLALGKRLWELPNAVTGKTTAFFEPALDYIVVKMPRWDLDKFRHADVTIGSEMKSVGEVMSIGRTFEEAIQKATRMLNDGYAGVIDQAFIAEKKHVIRKRLRHPSSTRLFTICTALYQGMSVDEIYRKTFIDRWFLHKLAHIVEVFKIIQSKKKLDPETIRLAKQNGFSDNQIASIYRMQPERVRAFRITRGIVPVVKQIDTLAGEFPARTNYLYLTYHGESHDYVPNKTEKKAIVIGSGPYSIGTSVEFDWCAVNTVTTLRSNGYKGIVINCNPETVSTDFDNSDYLYFEELTFERVLDIYDLERCPLVLSVGGQIPNNLAAKLAKLQVPILGPQPKQIEQAENRQTFSRLLDTLKISQPVWARAYSLSQALKICDNIGYPVLLRPSFVLSGKAMRVIKSKIQLFEYMEEERLDLREHPLLITDYLEHAQECDFDGVAANGKILLSVISEHIESAGIHSGDSSLILPPVTISQEQQATILRNVQKIISALRLSGPFNIQFLLTNYETYVIECNLRASRSFPFVSKVTGHNFITLATEVALGKKHAPITLSRAHYYGVKVPQFSFNKLKGADPVLQVEMNSTGEVAAVASTVNEAYLTALLATGVLIPTQKAAIISLGGSESKAAFHGACQQLAGLGYTLYATSSTAVFLKDHGITAHKIEKIHEGQELTALELIRHKRIDFIVNIVSDGENGRLKKKLTDGYTIRRHAIDFGIPVFTNIASAKQFVTSLACFDLQKLPVTSLQTIQKGVI